MPTIKISEVEESYVFVNDPKLKSYTATELVTVLVVNTMLDTLTIVPAAILAVDTVPVVS